jgi:hypothetical protein
MSEKKLVIDQLRLNYSGLFNLGDLFKTIDGWFFEKGYDRHEKKNEEQILPSGRFVEIELRPWKKTTDYAKNEIRFRLFVKDMKDVEVEKDGSKVKLQQGDIHMVFDAFLETDYEHRWESKPMFYFLRTLFDKFIFRVYTDKFEGVLVNDTHDLYNRVKSFLNLYRY